MPESGAGARPAAGSVGNPSRLQNSEGIALGFDFGTRRIGVAVGSAAGAPARPLCVVACSAAQAWDKIGSLIEEWQPSVLVVGIPRHPDGKPNQMTARCERFARQLQGRFGRTVACVDERYSSAVVGGAAASDDEAAAVILQQWLDEMLGAAVEHGPGARVHQEESGA
jgi:putative Holliday junction resolvase